MGSAHTISSSSSPQAVSGGPAQDQGRHPLLSRVLTPQCLPEPAVSKGWLCRAFPVRTALSLHKQRHLVTFAFNPDIVRGSSLTWAAGGLGSSLRGDCWVSVALGGLPARTGPSWLPGPRVHRSCAGSQANAILSSSHSSLPVGLPSRPLQPMRPGPTAHLRLLVQGKATSSVRAISRPQSSVSSWVDKQCTRAGLLGR